MSSKIVVNLKPIPKLGKQVAYKIVDPFRTPNGPDDTWTNAFLNANSIIPDRKPEIEGGWDANRKAFRITREATNPRLPHVRILELLSGYTSPLDDPAFILPDTKFYINRMQRIRGVKHMTPDGEKMHWYLTGDLQLLRRKDRGSFGMRPCDVVDRILSKRAFSEFMPTGTAISNRVAAFWNEFKLVDTECDNPVAYINTLLKAANPSDGVYPTPEDILQNMGLNLDRAHLTEMCELLFAETKFQYSGFITRSELKGLADNVDFRYHSAAPDYADVIFDGGDSSLESYVANVVIQTLSSMMPAFGYSKVSVVADSLDNLELKKSFGILGPHHHVQRSDDYIDEGCVDPYCEAEFIPTLRQHLKTFCTAMKISDIKFSVSVNIELDAAIKITVNNGREALIRVPMYASGLFSGQYTEFEPDIDHLAEYVERMVTEMDVDRQTVSLTQ